VREEEKWAAFKGEVYATRGKDPPDMVKIEKGTKRGGRAIKGDNVTRGGKDFLARLFERISARK